MESQLLPPVTSGSDITNINSQTWKTVVGHPIYIILYFSVFFAIVYVLPNPLVIFGMVLIGLFAYRSVYLKTKSLFTKEFGQSIGFEYFKEVPIYTVSGRLFQVGRSQHVLDVLSGTYQKVPLRIFSYRFTIGSGKSSQTYTYTVFEATMKNSAPSIILYSKRHVGVYSDMFVGNETIELEGDFNQYFKLRVPRGFEQQAYQIFTPDVMVNLIDRAKDVSFEFAGDKLYIYATKTLEKREELQSTLDLTVYLVGLFNKNTEGLD